MEKFATKKLAMSECIFDNLPFKINTAHTHLSDTKIVNDVHHSVQTPRKSMRIVFEIVFIHPLYILYTSVRSTVGQNSKIMCYIV